MTSNQLNQASSPYLLQHAANPVHWREWGAAALQEAQAAGKPILLSVGYAACHWCHVMAHESFEDAATAEVMNALFVNIKVDREERPDIDHIYMSALHAQGQQGGWPLTMFLTPKGEPFWGGTYFPKQARYGRRAFVDVLQSVAASYHDNPDAIRRNAAALTPSIDMADRGGGDIAAGIVAEAATRLAAAFDLTHGGLRGAPKFPNAPMLDFLLRRAAAPEARHLADPVLLTLRQMSRGGIFDHLGGGFSRYSVDERWLAPHFEKMLYDNAQLLELLAAAFKLSGFPLFRSRALETAIWLEREMTHPNGGFYASLDADSDGVEGKFYVWTMGQIEAVLGTADAAWFATNYDVTPGGNWSDDHGGPSVTILNRLTAPEATADTETRLASLRARMLAARGERMRPGLDDKILADWNGMMIAALVRAGLSLGQPRFIAMAAKAFEFVCHAMRDGDALHHSWRSGSRLPAGFASDYIFMARAALALHEAVPPASRSMDYVQQARTWLEALHRRHHDDTTGLLLTAARDAADVLVHLAPTADDATPNPHGHYAMALIELAARTGDELWRRRADAVMSACGPIAAANPYAHCSILAAAEYQRHVKEIVLFNDEANDLRSAALALPFHSRIIIDGAERPELGAPGRRGPFAVICQNQQCSLPLTSGADLIASASS